jgi:biofilm PGA synthesis N-glycosyltransferase PgaC
VKLSYAVITPVRDESENLKRLAESLRRQQLRPTTWVIVDTGSTDSTAEVADDLAATEGWISRRELESEAVLERGGPIVRAFELGLESVPPQAEVIVKLDADTSFEPDYFVKLLARFESEERLGMASGTCYELERGEWRPRFVTGTTVWGAARAYRRACLDNVLPLEQRMGWDGVDEFRANARGWTTRVFADLPFRHHRREGERDGSARRARVAQGKAAHYLGYRFWYLVLRALWNARREPAALAMIYGYLSATRSRAPRIGDVEARSYLRRQQSVLRLPRRASEAVGRRRRSAA